MSDEKRSVPSRPEVVVVGWGSSQRGGQSECVDRFVEVEDDDEVLGVVGDIVVFTPLKGQGFQMSNGLIAKSSKNLPIVRQWVWPW